MDCVVDFFVEENVVDVVLNVEIGVDVEFVELLGVGVGV